MHNPDNACGVEKHSPPLLQNTFALCLLLLVKDTEPFFAISGSGVYCKQVLRFPVNKRCHSYKSVILTFKGLLMQQGLSGAHLKNTQQELKTVEAFLIFACIHMPAKRKPGDSVQQWSSASTRSKINKGWSKHKLGGKRGSSLIISFVRHAFLIFLRLCSLR